MPTTSEMERRESLRKEVEHYPCIFNEEPRRALERLKELKSKLQIQMTVDNECQEEIISKLNLSTWIEFKLGKYNEAKENNNKAIEKTAQRNIAALVGHFYILLKGCDFVGAEDQLKKLKELQSSTDGETLMNEAKAELAYSYITLGGAVNISLSIEVYTQVIEQQPEKYVWKYRLGLAHRRATHRDMFHAVTSGIPLKEHARKAAEMFFDIENETVHLYFRGRAYSQLALMINDPNLNFSQMERDKLFHGRDFKTLIDEALKYGNDDAWTLTECGRILKEENSKASLNKSKKLLKKSLGLQKHSTTYHQLGLCYKKQANNKDPCSKLVAHEECDLRSTQPGDDQCITSAYDHHILRAIYYLERAISFSLKNNMPALKDLGLILIERGDFEDARDKFNEVISQCLEIPERLPKSEKRNVNENMEYVFTLTHAYEQAGLCLYKLAENPGITLEKSTTLNDEAERMLMIAVSLSARMSNLDSNIKNYQHEVWEAFSTLEAKYEANPDSPKVIKMYLQLLHRMAHFEKIPEIMEKLKEMSEEDFADPEVIKLYLEALLMKKKHEKAYALLSVATTGPLFESPFEPLRLKVCLYAAFSRLQAADQSAGLIFEPLFEHYIHSNDQRCSEGNSDEQVDKTIPDLPKKYVLIVYDQDDEDIEFLEIVKKIKEIFMSDFGLTTLDIGEEILPGTFLVNEADKLINLSRMVLCLVRDRKMSCFFRIVVECIPGAIEPCSSTRFLMGLLDDTAEIPPLLKKYRKVQLKEILNKIHEPSKPTEDLSDRSEEFDESVQAKMSLFCSIIDQKWPP